MLKNPYQSYKQKSVMTMTPADMLTTVYDELLKQITISKMAFENNDIVSINKGLQKVQEILRYLSSTLDHKYPVAENLAALYDYFIQVAIDANIKKDPSKLDEISQMITELRDTYIQASKKEGGR